jgi:hypothetical protein
MSTLIQSIKKLHHSSFPDFGGVCLIGGAGLAGGGLPVFGLIRSMSSILGGGGMGHFLSSVSS